MMCLCGVWIYGDLHLMLKISIKHLNASNGCDALIYHSELWHNRIMTEKETLFRVFVAVLATLSTMVLFPL